MANAYKGLTIRIGADTSDLQSALRASNRTIAATQSHLRQVQRMLKFDPSSAEAQAMQLKAIQTRAKGLSEKYAILNKEIRQLGSNRQLSKLAAETDDAAGHAERCRQRYAAVCDELAKFKHGLATAGKQSGFDRLASDIKTCEAEIRRLQKEDAELADAGAAKRNAAEIRQWQGYLKELRREYRLLEREAKNAFEGAEGVDATIARMKELGVWTERAEAEYRRLAKEHGRAFADNDLARQLMQLEQLKTDSASARAEVRSLANELVTLARAGAMDRVSSEFSKARRDILECDAAAKTLQGDFSKLMGAYSVDRWMDGLKQEIVGNVQRQLDVTREKAELLREQLKALDDLGLRGLTSEGQGAERALERVTAEAKEANAELLESKGRLQLLRDELSRTAEGSSEFAELKSKVSAANSEIAEMENRVRVLDALLDSLSKSSGANGIAADMYKAVASADKLEAKLKELNRTSALTKGTLQQLGWSMYSTVTPAVTMFAYRAISAAEEIDASYRNMRKTVEGTEQQFASLKQDAIDYSRTHYTSASDILDIEAMGGQLGIAVEQLESFSQVVSNLDIATNLNCDQASEQLGQLSAILNDFDPKKDEDFVSFGDALVRLGNNSATLESNIMDVTSRIGSMGTIVGMSTPQILAWATAVASTGQGSEAAGTAISKTMSDIESAVNSGGESLEAFAQVAGTSGQEFYDTWNRDPSAAMQAFVQGLRDIEAAGGSADGTLKSLKINSVRQKQALLGLSQTVGNLGNYMEMASDAWNGVSDEWGAAGDAAREADAKTQGFSGAIQLLRNNADAFGAEMGESVEEPLRSLATVLAGMTEGYSNLPDWAKWFINMSLAAAAATGPVVVFGNAFTSFMSERLAGTIAANSGAAISFLRAIGVEATASATAVKGLSIAMGALKTFGAMVGIMLAAQAVGTLVDYTKELVDRQTAGERSARAMSEALEAFDATSRSAASSMDEFGESAETAAARAADELGAVTDKAGETADRIASIAAETSGSISGAQYWANMISELSELGKQAGLTASQQAQLSAAVQSYNDVTGANVQVTDAATGALSHSTEEIRSNTAAWVEQTRAMGQQKMLQEAMNQVAEYEMKLAQAREAKKRLEDEGKYYRGVSGQNWADSSGIDKVMTDEAKKLEQELYSAEKGYEEAAKAANNMSNAVGMGNVAIEDATEATAQWGAQAQETEQQVEELETESQKLADALRTWLDTDNFMWGDVFSDEMERAGYSVEELAECMNAAGVTTEDLAKRFEAIPAATASAFQAIEENAEYGKEKAEETLRKNYELQKSYFADLKALMAEAKSQEELDYLNHLATEGGPEYAQLLEDYRSDRKALEEAAELFAKTQLVDDKAQAEYARRICQGQIEELSSYYQQAFGYTKEQADAMSKALSEAASAEGADQQGLASFMDGIVAAYKDRVPEMLEAVDFSQLAAAYASGGSEAAAAYLAEIGIIPSEARQKAEEASDEFRYGMKPGAPLDPSAVLGMDGVPLYARQKGEESAAEFNSGYQSGAKGTDGSAKEQVDAVKVPMDGMPLYAKQQSTKTGSEWAAGIANAKGPTQSAAKAVSDASRHIADYKSSARSDGYATGSNYAAGIRSAIPLIRAAAASASSAGKIKAQASSAPTTVTPRQSYSAQLASMPVAQPQSYGPQVAEAQAYMASYGASMQRESAEGLSARAELQAQASSPEAIGRAVARAMGGQGQVVNNHNSTTIRFEDVNVSNKSEVWDALLMVAREIEMEAKS